MIFLPYFCLSYRLIFFVCVNDNNVERTWIFGKRLSKKIGMVHFLCFCNHQLSMLLRYYYDATKLRKVCKTPASRKGIRSLRKKKKVFPQGQIWNNGSVSVSNQRPLHRGSSKWFCSHCTKNVLFVLLKENGKKLGLVCTMQNKKERGRFVSKFILDIQDCFIKYPPHPCSQVALFLIKCVTWPYPHTRFNVWLKWRFHQYCSSLHIHRPALIHMSMWSLEQDVTAGEHPRENFLRSSQNNDPGRLEKNKAILQNLISWNNFNLRLQLNFSA